MKEAVYGTEPFDQFDMVARVHAAVELIDNEMMERMRRNIVKRAEMCLEMHGGVFEQVLHKKKIVIFFSSFYLLLFFYLFFYFHYDSLAYNKH